MTPAPFEHQSDMAGVIRLIESGSLNPDEVIAATGKTEGSGLGERSRAIALAALRAVLTDRGTRSAAEIDEIPVVLSSGGPGLLAPHLMIYTRSPWIGPIDHEPRLTLGTAMTEAILPEHIGHVEMVRAVADGVRAAAADAGIDPSSTEYVLSKSHSLLPTDIPEAAERGVHITPFEPGIAVQRINGAASLGIAVAAEGMAVPTDSEIASNLELWSEKASASVGREDRRTHIVLLGNGADAGGHLRVAHAVMTDLLDMDALFRALRDAGLDVTGRMLTEEQRQRITAVYVKIGVPRGGTLRGRCQVGEDENPEYHNQLKAAVAGMFSAALQDTVLYISSGAMHQGPAGGGTVAVIVDHTPAD